MQVIDSVPTRHLTGHVRIARSILTGTLLVAAGAALGWLVVRTPLVAGLIPQGYPTVAQTAVGAVAWGFAIVFPAAFLLLGLARFATVVEAMDATRPHRLVGLVERQLGADHVAAMNIVLPGGRRVNELLIGPFGIVVLGDVPPVSVSRTVGIRWELKDERGRWIPIEHPVDRIGRDAERVRGWLSTEDRDFTVRVYGVVVTADRRVERSASCAVVSPADFPAWLAALPLQRGLTAERRSRIVDLVRGLATGR